VDTIDSDWVIVGRFGKVHGIKGLISVISFTEPRENILGYAQWHIKKNGQWQPVKRLTDEVTQKHILAQVEGYDIREDVASLTNFEIAVRRETLPTLALNEYYWHELVGMTVVHVNGGLFGQVHEIMATGSNDVFIVQGERRYLIPYLIDDVVVDIDKEKRQITVNWDLDF
jgi:16S rRNA processing protein RimM